MALEEQNVDDSAQSSQSLTSLRPSFQKVKYARSSRFSHNAEGTEALQLTSDAILLNRINQMYKSANVHHNVADRTL
jgi:hypothetical protein